MGSLQKEPEHRQHESLLGAVGLALGVFGVVVSVLVAVATPAAAMLGVGLLAGIAIGVLLTPAVKHGLAWLAAYLER